MNSIALSLPYPPTVNSYWRHPTRGKLAGRHLISAEGRYYQSAVIARVLCQFKVRPKLAGRLAVVITAVMPDRRKRDLDNIAKSLLDALTHAGIWLDDEQIDDLRLIRDGVVKGGRVMVTVTETQP